MGERRTDFGRAVLTSSSIVALMFLILGFELLFRVNLGVFGIVPRTKWGLMGILFAPLLHGSVQHLTANAAPLFVLLVLLISNPAYRPYGMLAWIWFASGFGTWLIGRGDAVHIGASAVIFGLGAFLIAAGFLLKGWRTLIVAVMVFFLYGGIFYGVLPHKGPISWEGHLCGAAAGLWAAVAQRRR